MENILDYQIINAIDASIYWKDLSGKYLGCNDYMAKMAGLSREQIIGNTDYLLPWKAQANKIREIDLLVIANCKKYQLEEKPLTDDGISKTFLSSKSPLLDKNNNVIGIIGVSIDITYYKKIEEEFEQTERCLDQYSTTKTRFLKNISHESRISLGSISSLSEYLKNDWEQLDDNIKRQSVELIFKEINRLEGFILNTFDIANFLNEGICLKLKKENFSKLVQDIITQCKKKFLPNELNIELNDCDDYYFSYDPLLIARVINNLLLNAIRYSHQKKKIMVGIYKTYLKNTEVSAIHFCITDEGVGVPESELDSIFDPFTESSITASKACGVGLGLSICKEIIEAHAGTIWVENNLIKSGASFNFIIPTHLLGLSASFNDREETKQIGDEVTNIIRGDLSRSGHSLQKDPFALVGISPFNSYFSTQKILQICEWLNNHYDDFGIFIPDEISRYTFEALGYDGSRLGRKIKKQDNYTINKVNTALEQFYKKNPSQLNIKIYTISDIRKVKPYQDLYHMYSNMFLKDKGFRENCLEVTEWVLQNNKVGKIEETQKNIAVQYFLFELPVMTFATTVLGIKACDFVYHNMPKFLKHLYLSKEFVDPNQRFLILK